MVSLLGGLLKNPLFKYIFIRLSFIILTFIIAITIIFILPRIIPGNPLATLLSRLVMEMQADPDQIKAVEKKFLEEFGWDKPIYTQYINFWISLLKGDLGTSIGFYPLKVTDLIFMYLPWTIGLLIPATVAAWILGNLLGTVAAYKRKTVIDNITLPIFLTLSNTPYYWLAMILLYVFAVNLKIFPIGGAYPRNMVPSPTPEFILAMLHHYTLPFLAIVIAALGGWAIGIRVMVIYELRSDYITYSDTLGLPDRKLLRYAFKNAMLPQVSGLALSLGGVLGGALITEIVFNYPGTGYILFKGLTTLDYPLIQGTAIILISTLLLSLFIVDFIYAYIDPRIKLGYTGE